MAGGALAMLGLPGVLATLLGLPAWLLLHVIVAVVRLSAGLPFAAIAIPSEAGPVAALLAAILVLAAPSIVRRVRAHRIRAYRIRRPARGSSAVGAGIRPPRRRSPLPASRGARVLAIVAGIVVALSTIALADTAGRETRLVMLDVGQGDAILVESRAGGRMLVDGGPDPERLLTELDARVPPWDRRVDLVVLTHPHEDHVAGLVRVLERYRVGRVFEPGMQGPGPGWEAWDTALREGPPRASLAVGAHLRLDEVTLTVVWPEAGTPVEPASTGRSINDTSIMLLGEANGRRFLLTGDAEDDVDPRLVTRGLPLIDVLKVAHHGSATATSAALLEAIRPAIALVSVGTGNDYGHPAPSTLARLRDIGARVYRTDLHGTLTVDLRSDGPVVNASGARRTGYDSRHDRPGAPRGRPPAALAGSARMVRSARLRRRGRRVLAGARDRPERHGDRRSRGRSGGTAPRRRQDPGGPHGRSPPRRRIRGLVGGAWLGGTVGAGPGPPRAPPRRRCRRRPPRRGAHRGPDHRLRRQTGRPAVGAHGRAVRLVGAPVPLGT
jgi:beta-lactamase superfamily II metal-dependent hydrolase